MTSTVYETSLDGVPLVARGKVRDIYDLGDSLLLVATDRLSAFDCVFPDPIPDKGKVLCQTSAFWFRRTASIVANHLITIDAEQFPERLRPFAHILRGRSSLVRKLTMIPI